MTSKSELFASQHSVSKFIIASSKPIHTVPRESKEPFFGSLFTWVSNETELESMLKEMTGIRYIFFLHWNWLVPESIWKNHECVCFHMTDVPYGRGGSPLQNLIVRGHTQTQLTALRMVKEMDAGPVYAKRPLSLEGTAHEIYIRAGRLSYEIMQWMIEQEPTPVAQEGEPTIFKRRKPEQSQLPSEGELSRIYDHIRMLDAPTYPHAFIEYGDFSLEFTGASIDEQEVSATVRFRRKIR